MENVWFVASIWVWPDARDDFALFGLDHHVIDRAQYPYLVATVIGSAVIPR